MYPRLRRFAVGLSLVSVVSLGVAGAAVSKPDMAPNLINNGGFE